MRPRLQGLTWLMGVLSISFAGTALAQAPEAIPPESALLELVLPANAEATLDGRVIADPARVIVTGLKPGQLNRRELTVRFGASRRETHPLLLKAGQRVRFALSAGAQPAELYLPTGHSRGVTAAALSDEWGLTGSADYSAILWERASGRSQRTLLGHRAAVTAAALSRNGQIAATGSTDQTAILWDIATGRRLHTLAGHTEGITSVVFSPDDKQVLTASNDWTAAIWDVQTGRQIQTFEGIHTAALLTASFSPDGKRVLTAGEDSTPVLWDAKTGKKLRSFEGLTGHVLAAAFVAGGQQVIAGGGENWIVWDSATGRKLRMPPGRKGTANRIALSPDGKKALIANVYVDHGAFLFDLETGKDIRRIAQNGREMLGLAFSSNGGAVFTGTGDGTATLWDGKSGEEIRTFRGLTSSLQTVRFETGSDQLLTGFPDGRAVLWDLAAGRQLPAIKGHTGSVTRVSYRQDGRRILTGSEDKTAILWDAQTGARLRTFGGHPSYLTVALFRPKSDDILLAADEDVATLWDALTGAKLRSFRGHKAKIHTAHFSDDGKRALTSAWDGRAILWNVETGAEIRSFPCIASAGLLSPDGKRVAANEAIWDAESGEKIADLAGRLGLAAEYSPDGKWIVSTPSAFEATVWDAQTGKERFKLDDDGLQINAVAFTPDSKRILLGGYDRVSFWNAETGKKVRHWDDVDGSGLKVSPDGHWMLASSRFSAVIRDMATGQPARFLPPSTAFNKNDLRTADGKLRIGRQVAPGSREPYQYSLYDVESRKEVASLFHSGLASLWAVHPKQSWLLFGDGSDALLLDFQGKEVRRFSHTGTVVTAGFNRDGSLLLTSSADQTAALWDVETGRILRVFGGHTGGTTGAAFSPDEEKVATTAGDGSTRLWDLATGVELARLISLEEGKDWVVVTPGGLFDGSRGGREAVAFRIGGKDLVPLDRFFQDFYSPGLLADLWNGERPLPGQTLKADPTPLLRMLVQPGTDGAKVTIDVSVTDRGGGIRGPWLRHNGAAVKIPSTIERKEGKTAVHRFTVPLVSGANLVEAVAATADGVRESERVALNIPFNGRLPAPRLHVLAVGIDRFAPGAGVSPLEFCGSDTRAVAEMFRKRSDRRFGDVQVTQLLDEQATKAGILRAIGAISRRAQPQDALVVYVASHGIAIGQRFYVIPHDFRLGAAEATTEAPPQLPTAVSLRGYRSTDNARESAVRQTALAIDELGEALAEVPALKRVLVFDTCHSGSAVQLAGKARNPFAFRGAVERFGRSQGVYSLSATAADELAAETKELGHSILTYALLAGMGATSGGPLKDNRIAARPDDPVDVLQWFEYARQQVPGLYSRYVGRTQQVELHGDDQPTFPLLGPVAK